MEVVPRNTELSARSELDYFVKTPIDASLESTFYEAVRPTTAYHPDSLGWTFDIPPGNYIDLSDVYLWTDGRIVDAKKQPIRAQDSYTEPTRDAYNTLIKALVAEAGKEDARVPEAIPTYDRMIKELAGFSTPYGAALPQRVRRQPPPGGDGGGGGAQFDAAEFARLNKDGIVRKRDNVSVVQSVGQSLIKNIVLRSAGEKIYDTGTNYAHMAHAYNMLSYSKNVFKAWLGAAGYGEDEIGKVDVVDDSLDRDEILNMLKAVDTKAYNAFSLISSYFVPKTSGFKQRAEPYKNGGQVETYAPLVCGAFNGKRFWLADRKLEVCIQRNIDKFVLHYSAADTEDGGNGPYHYYIDRVALIVRKAACRPELNMAIMNQVHLRGKTATIPFIEHKINTYLMPAGPTTLPEYTLYNGPTPRRAIIGFIPEACLDGIIGRNALHFKNPGFETLQLRIGSKIYPAHDQRLSTHSILPDGSTKNAFGRQAYMDMFTSFRQGRSAICNSLSFDEWLHNCTLFVIDLQPSVRGGPEDRHAIENVAITCQGKLTAPLEENLKMMVILELESSYNIDHSSITH